MFERCAAQPPKLTSPDGAADPPSANGTWLLQLSRPERLPILAKRKTPPERWLRSGGVLRLDQDGVDFPGSPSAIRGTDLIIGNIARARALFIDIHIVVLVVIVRFGPQILRRDGP
jgi:hypothetical protein